MDDKEYSIEHILAFIDIFKVDLGTATLEVIDAKDSLSLVRYGVSCNDEIDVKVSVNLALLNMELERCITNLNKILGDLPAVKAVINQKPNNKDEGSNHKINKPNNRYATFVSKNHVLPISKLTKDK